ncbi:MAG TPA: TIGR03619 family F420-dependent LLM class oxidoreductase [Streptosporangiaceae bacterium]|jgi:probable F420-dependent oxidoreductase|nr:TIGR03619 family F420-dependent LLM class oxidoreductase [Streptosporangiaceae bacterium]
MQIGFGAPVSGTWATPRDLASFGSQAEDAGYASLWTFQRLLVPESTPMEPVYASVLDPLVSLGFLAAGTTQIRLGVALVNLPFISPGYLAKQATTVDVLSGGRLDLGLGIGWLPEEFELTGASMARRGARASEYVAALHALWNPGPDGLSRFEGEFYSVPAGRQQPTPVQQPGPPVILGGMARPAMERAGRIADGWMTSSRADLTRIADDIKIVRAAATGAGRDPERVRIVCRGVVRAGEEARNSRGERRLLSGSYDQIRADTDWLAERGVTELFYDLNWDPLIGSPDVDHAAAVARAAEIMAALAPAR